MNSSTLDISIGKYKIGHGHPCFIIAEIGVNHNGEYQLAKQLIDAAAQAGANAVKFQTFKAERFVSHTAPKAKYQLQTTEANESQLDMVRRLELSPAVQWELQAYCRQRDLLFLSTPFDEESVDLLDRMDVPLFKIGSGEITNLPFLGYVARMGKPIILSTGMSHLWEVEQAVDEIRKGGCDHIILLHCVSNYPAHPEEVNLRAMDTLAETFKLPVGYSDHTIGIEVSLAAVARGACIIEKHLTLDRSLPGPDHQASIETQDFATLTKGIRTVEVALGHGRKVPAPSEAEMTLIARKSLFAARDIPACSHLQREWIVAKRPGTGLSPAMLTQLIGRIARCDIPMGTMITLEMLA